MTAIVTNSFRLKSASLLKDELSDLSNSLYLFVSKPTAWVNESLPTTPTESQTFERMIRDEMISLRKISSTEITRSIFRIDWVSGKFYDMYRNDYDGVKLNGVNLDTGVAVAKTGINSANFYVVTDEFNVYKCISNNNRAASTVKPTGTSTSVFTTSDGYRWKYMLTINASDALKFATKNYLPVQSFPNSPGASSPYYNQYLVQSSAINGTIDVIEIVSSGNGYPASTTLSLNIIGDGTGATGTATTNGAGQITSINITSVGSGYTYAVATVTGAFATPASLNCIVSPKGGHGKNPLEELNATYITVSGSIGDDLTETTLKENQYRAIGLIFNPFAFGTQNILTSQTANALRAVQINGGVTGTFSDDENLITSNTPNIRGKFIAYSPTSKLLKYIRNPENTGLDFSISDTVTGATSSASGVVTSIVNPDIDINSGEILYIETRPPIFRSISQKEEMRITIET